MDDVQRSGYMAVLIDLIEFTNAIEVTHSDASCLTLSLKNSAANMSISSV